MPTPGAPDFVAAGPDQPPRAAERGQNAQRRLSTSRIRHRAPGSAAPHPDTGTSHSLVTNDHVFGLRPLFYVTESSLGLSWYKIWYMLGQDLVMVSSPWLSGQLLSLGVPNTADRLGRASHDICTCASGNTDSAGGAGEPRNQTSA